MHIVLEGVDGTGKSTLAAHLSRKLNMPIIGSEGPPKYLGEMNERLTRYIAITGDVIFDRHPIISQPIYDQLRNSGEPMDLQFAKQFFNADPIIIYCDPGVRFTLTNHRRNPIDTDEHIMQIEANYELLLSSYRHWAVQSAFICYRIGDNMDRIVDAVAAIKAEEKP